MGVHPKAPRQGIPCLAAGMLVLALGCTVSGSRSGRLADASFALAAAPASLEVPSGGSGYVTVTATRYGSFAEAITLTVEGLPAGMEATGTIPAGQATGFLTVAVATTVPARDLGTLQLLGSAGSLRQSTPIALAVLAPLPETSLDPDRAQASGGVQSAGGLANTTLVQEPVAAVVSRDPSGRVELRHGFLPVSQPNLP